jgi:hypothetical protein
MDQQQPAADRTPEQNADHVATHPYAAQWDPTQPATLQFLGVEWQAVTCGTMMAFCGLTEEEGPYWERSGGEANEDEQSLWLWCPASGVLGQYRPDGTYSDWHLTPLTPAG